MKLKAIACALLCLLAVQPSQACLHLPVDYEGSLEQQAQGGIVFWRAGKEDLILKVDVDVEGKTAPASLAWVVPVPTKPTDYAEVDPKVFEAMFKAWVQERGQYRTPKGRVFAVAGSAGRAVKVVERRTVGAYEISVVSAKDPAALNVWLKGQGYGVVPEESLRFYVERKHTWVCVKTRPAGKRLELKPLRITFATPRIVYPLKFSTHQGTFDFTLYVITEHPLTLAQPKWQSVRRKLGGPKGHSFYMDGRFMPLPKVVAAAAKGAIVPNRMGVRLPYVTVVAARKLKGASAAAWTKDLELEQGKPFTMDEDDPTLALPFPR
jgi:hypothetical protein